MGLDLGLRSPPLIRRFLVRCRSPPTPAAPRALTGPLSRPCRPPRPACDGGWVTGGHGAGWPNGSPSPLMGSEGAQASPSPSSISPDAAPFHPGCSSGGRTKSCRWADDDDEESGNDHPTTYLDTSTPFVARQSW